MIKTYNEHRCCVRAIRKLEESDEENYGIVHLGEKKGDVYNVKELKEKPEIKSIESSYAILGRYILAPEIFKELEDMTISNQHNIELTDALNRLAQQKIVYAYMYDGERATIPTISRRLLNEQIEELVAKRFSSRVDD